MKPTSLRTLSVTMSIYYLTLSITWLRCTACPPGSFRTGNGTCQTCPPGTQQPDRNMDSCTPCRAGTFADFRGIPTCTNCPPGTFSSSPGSKTCLPCPRGTDSRAGYSRCIRCPAGMRLLFRPLSTTEPCEKCPRNMFSARKGNRECTRCPPGTVSRSKGATKCEKCPKGTLPVQGRFGNMISCKPCDKGTFNDEEGAKSCKICRPGTFSEAGAEKCTPCPAGKFAPQIASRKCKSCPSGTDTLGLKPAACKDPVRGCTFTTFENADGECEACMPGEKLDKSRRKCVPCGVDEISHGGVSTVCKKCPSGQLPVKGFGLRDGAICVCRIGTQAPQEDAPSCDPCPIGMFGGDPGVFNEETQSEGTNGLENPRFNVIQFSCLRCPRGTTSVPGSTVCTTCPPEFDALDQTVCIKCAPGTQGLSFFYPFDPKFVPRGSVSGSCRVEDTGCPIGTVPNRRVSASFEPCVLERCPKHQFFNKNKVCQGCRPGQFRRPDSQFRLFPCIDCPLRQRSPGGITRRCTKCPAGKVGSGNLCICAEGTEAARKNCVDCPAGTFGNSAGMKCAPCTPGTFTSTRGNTFCDSCPPDTITSGPGAMKCTPCPDGAKNGVDLLSGDRVNTCVPKDPYNKDPALLALL